MIVFLFSCQSKQQQQSSDNRTDNIKPKNEYKRIVLNEQIFDTISDWNLDVVVLDQISDRVNWKDTTESEFQAVSHLDSISRGIYATWILDGQVSNGGFNQFFYNYNGNFLDDAIIGFTFLGATGHGEIAIKARERLKTEKIKIEEVRKKGDIKAFMESYADINFSDLDDSDFKLNNIQEYRLKFIKDHKDKFVEK